MFLVTLQSATKDTKWSEPRKNTKKYGFLHPKREGDCLLTLLTLYSGVVPRLFEGNVPQVKNSSYNLQDHGVVLAWDPDYIHSVLEKGRKRKEGYVNSVQCVVATAISQLMSSNYSCCGFSLVNKNRCLLWSRNRMLSRKNKWSRKQGYVCN